MKPYNCADCERDPQEDNCEGCVRYEEMGSEENVEHVNSHIQTVV